MSPVSWSDIFTLLLRGDRIMELRQGRACHLLRESVGGMLPCGFGGGNDNENTNESVCGGDDSDDGGSCSSSANCASGECAASGGTCGCAVDGEDGGGAESGNRNGEGATSAIFEKHGGGGGVDAGREIWV